MRRCANPRLASDGSYPDLQATRINAVDRSSTIDYHNSLLDQARQQHELERPRNSNARQCHTSQNHSLGSLRQWLPLSNSRRPGTTENNNSSSSRCRRAKNEKDQNSREVAPAPHPHLTRKDIEEFEALPLAIRRKYFSTLERLRLARSSGILDPPADDCRHHKLRGASLSAAPGKPLDRPTTAPSHHHAVSADFAFLAKLPPKIREKHLTREEQVVIAKHLRQSVILDAADEAFLKAGRLASRRPTPPLYPPTLSSSGRPSMESLLSDKPSPGAPDALYDSFRWLDEEEDLDLRLALDDYHVNLRESVPTPPTPKDARPPSFRRHLSFSKIPFGRPSVSSSRPGTKDAAPPTANSASQSPVTFAPPLRRKSRALSLITPKHSAQESISSIDPAAAHYQDPEARLKLRVYLASPQKFDEAIEFGFPSNDPSPADLQRDLPNATGQSRLMFSPDSEKFKTFLSDDKSSTYSDDASLPDPESPRTPDTPDKHVKPLQLPSNDDYSSRLPEGYAQVPAASREMTLRMTLTRPDLRACEDQIYGWQKGSRQHSSKASQVLALRDDMPTSTYIRDGPKESMDRIFADIDQELGTHSTDSNVMKRIWNRVRRG
ncbi:hypothetical protein F5Y05DRAFT_390006 [Hypoxylon sp. FL0543]|nr:hypothetical protein F5Y05DRAFT_390006 [Hypoxylon sp. FL0543]